MSNSNKKIFNVFKIRIIFNIILFLAVFYTPWWIVVALAFIGVFMWPLYLEILFFGILLDILYGASTSPLGGLYGILGAVAILVAVSYARRAVR